MLFDKYPRLLNYNGVLKKGILIKLLVEMNGYGISADFNDDVLYTINDYLINWCMRYIKFFKCRLTNDVYVTTYNIIYNNSRLKKCVTDKIIQYYNYMNVPIISRIGNDLYLTMSKEFMPPAFINRIKLPFSIDTIKQILLNEGVDLGTDIEYALLSIALGSILELLIYVMFNDADNNFKEITVEHVDESMRTLNILLLIKGSDRISRK